MAAQEKTSRKLKSEHDLAKKKLKGSYASRGMIKPISKAGSVRKVGASKSGTRERVQAPWRKRDDAKGPSNSDIEATMQRAAKLREDALVAMQCSDEILERMKLRLDQ